VLIGALSLYRGVVVNLHLESGEHAHVRIRLLTLPILAAAFYVSAKLAALRDDPEQRTIRGLFAAAGSAFIALLIWFEVPELWQPLAFIAFAVILSEAAGAIRYHALAWQANVVGLCALLRAYFYNYNLEQKFWGAISSRIFTISVVAAGLYFLSRKAAPEERFARAIAFLHSFAATGLLALLAWYEAP